MTRFARARGSKSSNERLPEDATAWSVMKRQLVEKNRTTAESPPDDKSAVKSFISKLKEPAQGDSNWADFGHTTPQPNKSKHHKKQKNQPEADVSATQAESCPPKKPKKNKKSKGKKTENSETEGNATDTSAQKEPTPDVNATDDTGKAKKSKKRKHSTNDDFSAESSKKMKHAFEANQPSQSQQGPGTPKKNKNKKRRRQVIENTTITVDGRIIHVSIFDGFDVKSEDAERLKELKKKMFSEGIPRAEIEREMKLERRRAEKALAREKKKVCFNCRKAGHVLSECPEINGSSQRGWDSGTTGICYKCGSTEHTHFECKVQKKDKYSFATCFICKEQGHISSQCPDNPRGLYPNGGCCIVCSEVTHLKKDCPQLAKERSENTVTVDTLGSGRNLEGLDEDVAQSKSKQISPKQKQSKKKIVKF